MKGNSNRAPLRILCISPLFAPAADAEAFCAAKMVQSLINCGTSVKVVTSTDIYCALRTDPSHMWNELQDVIVNVPQLRQPHLIRSICAASQFQTLNYARWVGSVIQTAKNLHKATKFDFVYTRSQPTVAHIAGFWCARRLRIPWIANINDPWELNAPGLSVSQPLLFKSRTHLFWLRRTLRTADLVTYPCESLYQFHVELSKVDHAATIIPHIGYRPKSAQHMPDGCFRLVHAGTLGRGEVTGRSANTLLLGLQAFLATSPEAALRTKLLLAGPRDEGTEAMIDQLELRPNVQSLGRVSYEESLRYIISAAACILIEGKLVEGILFPSKLADYLVCRKPVLALSPRTGFAADLAARGELLRVDHDPTAVRDALSTLYADFTRGKLGSLNPSNRLVAEFEGQNVARTFLAACQTLTLAPHSTV